jgi:hypothetical protein
MHHEPELPSWLATLAVMAQEFQPIPWWSVYLG